MSLRNLFRVLYKLCITGSDANGIDGLQWTVGSQCVLCVTSTACVVCHQYVSSIVTMGAFIGVSMYRNIVFIDRKIVVMLRGYIRVGIYKHCVLIIVRLHKITNYIKK